MDKRAKRPDEPNSDPPMLQVWLLVVAALLVGYFLFSIPETPSEIQTVSYSEFRDLVRAKEIDAATIEATAIVGSRVAPTSEGAQTVRAILPQMPDPTLLPLLEEHGVIVTAKAPRAPSILVSFLPWLLLLAFYYLAQSPNDGRGSGWWLWCRNAARSE